MCGDKEVLRDEAIFVSFPNPALHSLSQNVITEDPCRQQMAHRAAHPEKYPVRKGILEANPSRTEKGTNYPPTKVSSFPSANTFVSSTDTTWFRLALAGSPSNLR
jgi:hypothetical protein